MTKATVINANLPEVQLIQAILQNDQGNPDQARQQWQALLTTSTSPAWIVNEARRLLNQQITLTPAATAS